MASNVCKGWQPQLPGRFPPLSGQEKQSPYPTAPCCLFLVTPTSTQIVLTGQQAAPNFLTSTWSLPSSG